MSGNYFISDLHIGHKNIIKYRSEFDDLDSHNSRIFSGVESTAGKRNNIFLLGDNAFTLEGLEMVNDMTRGYGKVIYCIGNHDFERGLKAMDVYDVFGGPERVMLIGLWQYKEFWLSHAPIHPAELRKKINIHGHVHNQSVRLENGELDPYYVNVSAENVNYTPISLDEIRGMCAGLPRDRNEFSVK